MAAKAGVKREWMQLCNLQKNFVNVEETTTFTKNISFCAKNYFNFSISNTPIYLDSSIN